MKNKLKKSKKKLKNVINKKSNDKQVLYITIAIIIAVLILSIFLALYDNKWVIDGNTISKGEVSYEIGDYFDYDESKGGKITGLTDVKWKVLGVDDRGKLLIVADASVEDLTLGSEDDFAISQEDYVSGIDKINEICKKYGKGKAALGARSITFDDIVTTFNVNEKYINSIYGEYTYYWDEDLKLYSVSETGEIINDKIHDDKFIWYDEETSEWKTSLSSDFEKTIEHTKIVTMKDTLKALNQLTYDEEIKDYVLTFNGSEKKKNMLFTDENNDINTYWTTDRFVNSTGKYLAYGYNVIKGDSINYAFLTYSLGKSRENTHGIRPVITIK